MTRSSTNSTTSPNYSLRYLATLYGSIGGGLMIAYFLLFNALGLQAYQAIRFSSYLFLLLAVVLALRAFKRRSPRPAPYLSGLGLGLAVGLISSLLFATFLLLYGGVLHPAYQTELQSQQYFNNSIGLLALAATVVLLGGILGGLASFTSMMTEDGAGGDRVEQKLEELSS